MSNRTLPARTCYSDAPPIYHTRLLYPFCSSKNPRMLQVNEFVDPRKHLFLFFTMPDETFQLCVSHFFEFLSRIDETTKRKRRSKFSGLGREETLIIFEVVADKENKNIVNPPNSLIIRSNSFVSRSASPSRNSTIKIPDLSQ